ncbi:MAG: hypothetical protein ACJAZX_001568 [Rickettsiales bacterium]|jgi:uncharacterized protein (TIGR01777 family)
MKYLITGGTGFVGQKLIANLINSKQEIIVLGREKSKIEKIFNSKVRAIANFSEIGSDEKIDCIVNLAGENIASKRWSKKQKEILLNSRILTTKRIVELVSRLNIKPETLINASAIGFYGSRGNEELDENSKAGDEFTSNLCQKWEEEARKVEKFGVRVCLTRFGIVLGKNGGALAKMVPAFKFGLGGKIASGKQIMSFIHILDLVSAINFLIDNKNLNGVFNLTSPNSVSNQEFTKILSKNLTRPAFFDMPEFMVKILFGEMGEILLVNGQNVLPKRLLKSGFEFKFENLDHALKNLLK